MIKNLFLFLIFLFCLNNVFSTFSLNGNTITQSGTDLDLSSLSSISEVDYFETTNGVNTYRIATIPANYLLNIDGDLTIDANTDMLVIEHTANNFLFSNINGVLRIKDSSNNGIENKSYQKTALMILARTDNHWNSAQGMNIYGELEMDGGTLYSNSHINFMSDNSKLNVLSESVIRLGVANNGFNNMIRIGGTRADININGLILLESANGFETADILELNNYAPQFNKEGIMVYGGANNGEITLYSFNPYGNEKDFAFIASGSYYKVYGYPNKEPTASVHFDHTSASGGGNVDIRKKLKLNVLDSSNNLVEGAILYIKDIDNGLRYNKINDYTNDFEYQNSTNEFGELELDILLANVQVGRSENVGKNSDPRDVDYRVKKDDGTEYKLDGTIISYNNQIKSLNDIDLGGLDSTNEITEKLLTDTSITELDKSIVENYNGIDINHNLKEITITQNYDLSNLYDYLKYDKLNNLYNSNYEVGELFFSGDGTTLNLGDYNLIVDSTTLSQSNKFEKVITSGEIQNLNNGVLDFSYEDLNGDSALYFSSNWKLFNNIEDAKNSSISPIASGTANDIFRFFKPTISTYRVVELYQNGVYQYVDIDLSNGFQTIDISLEGSVEDINTKMDLVIENQNNHTSYLSTILNLIYGLFGVV